MKSLKLIILLCLCFVQAVVFAQDTVFVSFDKVTSIAFPSGIKDPINIEGDIITTVVKDNTLGLRAAEKGFTGARLQLTTADGSVYDFPVVYSYGRAGKLIRIARLPSYHQKAVPVKSNTIESISRSIAKDKKFNRVSHDKNGKIKSDLGSIAISGDTLFYKIRLSNRSNISYDIDFIRFYVRDLERAKRTVTQEQEIYPVYSYGLDNPSIEGKARDTLVFALNKFPITSDKALFVEVYEKNGGRHLYLKVKQSDIEKARVFKPQNLKL